MISRINSHTFGSYSTGIFILINNKLYKNVFTVFISIITHTNAKLSLSLAIRMSFMSTDFTFAVHDWCRQSCELYNTVKKLNTNFALYEMNIVRFIGIVPVKATWHFFFIFRSILFTRI